MIVSMAVDLARNGKDAIWTPFWLKHLEVRCPALQAVSVI
jgi:hypothetical protein